MLAAAPMKYGVTITPSHLYSIDHKRWLTWQWVWLRRSQEFWQENLEPAYRQLYNKEGRSTGMRMAIIEGQMRVCLHRLGPEQMSVIAGRSTLYPLTLIETNVAVG